MSDDTSSGYASARATLRETVKWLVAAFASVAAVIVAGSPLSNPDDVDIANVYFISSVVLAIVALGLVGRALHITLDLLRPDGLYSSALCREIPGESREITDACSEINRHRDDLLPAGYANAEELWNQRLTTIRALDGQLTAEQETEFTAHLVDVEAALGRLLDFGLYHTLYARLRRAQPRLLTFGLLVLICLTLSVALGKSAKDKVDGPSVVIVQPAPSQPIPKTSPTGTPPRLEPVQFESGSANVSAEGVLARRPARSCATIRSSFSSLPLTPTLWRKTS